MSLWSRLRLLFQIKAAGALREAEDPRQVLDYAYEQQQELLRKVRQGLVDVATSKVELERQAKRLRQQGPVLDEQARRALAASRDDLARAVLERKHAISAELDSLERQLAEVETEQQKLTLAQQQLTARIEEFRTHKEVVAARFTAAQAQVRIGEALGGVSGGELAELSMAVGRAEERAERLQARAAAVGGLLEGGVFESRLGISDSVEQQLRRVEVAAAVDNELELLRAAASQPRLIAHEPEQKEETQ